MKIYILPRLKILIRKIFFRNKKLKLRKNISLPDFIIYNSKIEEFIKKTTLNLKTKNSKLYTFIESANELLILFLDFKASVVNLYNLSLADFIILENIIKN